MKFKLIEELNDMKYEKYPLKLNPGDIVEEYDFSGDENPEKFIVDFIDNSHGKIYIHTKDNRIFTYDSGESSIFKVLGNVLDKPLRNFKCLLIFPSSGGQTEHTKEDKIMAVDEDDAYSKFRQKYPDRKILIRDVKLDENYIRGYKDGIK